jgi:hypothetical protein
MTRIRINKLEAAQRQIDAAIRMTFNNEDAIAIHSVAAAAHRIVKDLCEQRGDVESYLMFTDWIRPGYERKFWRQMNSSANFFKHADEDAERVHELETEASDYLLLFFTKWYADLGNALSPEMRIFALWLQLRRPELLKPEAAIRMASSSEFYPASSTIKAMSREDSLKVAQRMLEHAKSRRGNRVVRISDL